MKNNRLAWVSALLATMVIHGTWMPGTASAQLFGWLRGKRKTQAPATYRVIERHETRPYEVIDERVVPHRIYREAHPSYPRHPSYPHEIRSMPSRVSPSVTPGQTRTSDPSASSAQPGSAQPGQQSPTGDRAAQSPDSSAASAAQSSDASASSDALASAMGASAAVSSSAPNMLGDLFGFSQDSSFNIARQRTITRTKVAENANVRPISRAFYNYHWFSNVFETNIDVHRHVPGFEQTFFDGLASVEVRTSINTLAGDRVPGNDGTEVGNLVTTFKGIMYQSDPVTISGGLAIGFPIGPVADGAPGGNALFMPFIGYQYAPETTDFFVHGFSQIDIPTASEDQGMIHTDIGFGYWVRRNDPNNLVSSIAPTVEFHAYTPYGDAPTGSLTGLIYNDVLNMTLGTTFVIGRATIALGLGVPLSSRTDYDVEGQIQFNFFR